MRRVSLAPTEGSGDPLTEASAKELSAADQSAGVVVKPQTHDTVLVMRADESIWHFTEPEGEVAPGARRPLLIIDEQVVHLAHTDRRLEPEELLQRVQTIIDKQQVPVQVELVSARWLSDPSEVRPRLVASLREHPYSDIKMIMGVDYMGNWASILLHLGHEPEPIPPEPKWEMPLDAIVAFGLGGILALVALGQGNIMMFFCFGIIPLAYGAWRTYTSYEAHKAKTTAQRLKKQVTQVVERLKRTYKVDDMRLFCTAMRQVFQAVVDDIVQRGAEVVRVEGGKGGYFYPMTPETKATGARLTDAARGEI